MLLPISPAQAAGGGRGPRGAAPQPPNGPRTGAVPPPPWKAPGVGTAPPLRKAPGAAAPTPPPKAAAPPPPKSPGATAAEGPSSSCGVSATPSSLHGATATKYPNFYITKLVSLFIKIHPLNFAAGTSEGKRRCHSGSGIVTVELN
ncbi:unnamed protein product [Urochloa humidicola]